MKFDRSPQTASQQQSSQARPPQYKIHAMWKIYLTTHPVNSVCVQIEERPMYIMCIKFHATTNLSAAEEFQFSNNYYNMYPYIQYKPKLLWMVFGLGLQPIKFPQCATAHPSCLASDITACSYITSLYLYQRCSSHTKIKQTVSESELFFSLSFLYCMDSDCRVAVRDARGWDGESDVGGGGGGGVRRHAREQNSTFVILNTTGRMKREKLLKEASLPRPHGTLWKGLFFHIPLAIQ